MRREPVDYSESANHFMHPNLTPLGTGSLPSSTVPPPINYILQDSNHTPPGYYPYWPLAAPNFANARLWGLDKMLVGDYASINTGWKLGFSASGGPYMLQDPLVNPVIVWDSGNEWVTVTFDTDWMELVADPRPCYGNWWMSCLGIWNQDDVLLGTFVYSRGGGMEFSCDPTTVYYLRIPALQFRVWKI